MSVYDGEPEDNWLEITRALIAKHPLEPDEIVDVVKLCWTCVAVERPRVRSADGQAELPLATYAHFGDRDPLTKMVLERMLAGVSTRRFRRTQEPVGEQTGLRPKPARPRSRLSRAPSWHAPGWRLRS